MPLNVILFPTSAIFLLSRGLGKGISSLIIEEEGDG